MEIERKFLVRQMPEELDQYRKKKIEQAYLCEDGCVLRVRKSNERYILTYKQALNQSSQALVNVEEEFEITENAFRHLADKADGNRIMKTRYLIPLAEGLTAELDVFEGVLEGLCVVEVEFDNVEHAAEWIKPDWFGEEVTNRKTIRNSELIWISDWRRVICENMGD